MQVSAKDAAGSITCLVTNYGEVSGAGFDNCETGLLSEGRELHLPLISYLDLFVWADLVRLPSTDGQIRFAVTDYGINRSF